MARRKGVIPLLVILGMVLLSAVGARFIGHGMRENLVPRIDASAVPIETGVVAEAPRCTAVFTNADQAISCCAPRFAERITDRQTWTPMWKCEGDRITDGDIEATIPPQHGHFGHFTDD